MRNKRNALEPDVKNSADEQINNKLFSLASKLPPATIVSAYLPTLSEIDILPFVRRCMVLGLPVVVPRWNGVDYELATLPGAERERLEVGPMGVLQPPQTALKVSPEVVGLWVVPALAYTCSGRRLGYGGGWYDRMLSSADERSVKIGVAYSFQVLGEIPQTELDVPVTFVVTSDFL